MGLNRNNWEFLEDIFLPILGLFSRKKKDLKTSGY